MWAKNAEFVTGKFPFIIFKMKIYKRKKMWTKNAEFVTGKFPFIIFKMKIYKRKKYGPKMLNSRLAKFFYRAYLKIF